MKKVAVGAILLVAGVAAGKLLWPKAEADKQGGDADQQRATAIPLNLDAFVAAHPKLRQSLSPPRRTAAKASLPSRGPAQPSRRAPAPAPPAVSQATVRSLVDNANQLLTQGKRWEARQILSKAFFVADKELAPPIKAKLDELNGALIFSPEPTPGSVIHAVQRAETLGQIAREYSTTYRLIMRVNRKSDDRIRIDERLKILKGTPSIVVDKSGLTLTLLLDNVYVKLYPVCIGQFDKTPVGTFEVSIRQEKPTWYAPDGGVYRYGHPKHQLGTRWIGFRPKPGLSGYGIHGTHDPASVPGRESQGCVRLRNADVEELFDFVVIGTKIEIRE